MVAEEGRRIVRAVRSHSQFADSPRDRLGQLCLEMLSDPTLPNVALGGAMSATVSWVIGLAPLSFALASWAVWLLAVGIYMIGEEVATALVAAKNELEASEESEASYQ